MSVNCAPAPVGLCAMGGTGIMALFANDGVNQSSVSRFSESSTVIDAPSCLLRYAKSVVVTGTLAPE